MPGNGLGQPPGMQGSDELPQSSGHYAWHFPRDLQTEIEQTIDAKATVSDGVLGIEVDRDDIKSIHSKVGNGRRHVPGVPRIESKSCR